MHHANAAQNEYGWIPKVGSLRGVVAARKTEINYSVFTPTREAPLLQPLLISYIAKHCHFHTLLQ